MSDLTPNERDEYEERAAIIEYDGKMPRALAEKFALRWVLARRPKQESLALGDT